MTNLIVVEMLAVWLWRMMNLMVVELERVQKFVFFRKLNLTLMNLIGNIGDVKEIQVKLIKNSVKT